MLSAATIGDKITVARKMKNLSQSQLAQMLSVSSQAVGKWERGESMPDIITFNRLAESLGTDLNYFSESYRPAPGSAQPEAVLENDFEKEAEMKKPGWNMSASIWKDADFSGLKNLYERFGKANINNCLFVGSELSGITFKGNNITDSDFSRSVMRGSRVSHSHMAKNIFAMCDLGKSVFQYSSIEDCDFTGANVTGAAFKASEIKKCKVGEVVWNHITFSGTGFAELVIEGEVTDCSFENCKYSKTEFRNVTFRNTFFKNGNMKKIAFTNCKADNLTYAFLKNGKANMSGIELLEGGL
jgi:uncharacterized protein YjbI with pentapeptide repeats